MIVGGEERMHVIGESIVEDGGANAVTKANDEALVVDAGESFAS